MQWFYAEGDHQRGPAEEREIPDLIESGAIGPQTLVWRDGMADWEPAQRHFGNLFPAGGQPPLLGAAAAPPPGRTGQRDYRRKSGMGDAFQLFFANYFNFSDRSNRGEFWFWTLDNILITMAIGMIDAIIFGAGQDSTGLIGGIWGLATLIPGIALSVRRLHDIDKSGWFLLLILIPIIGWIILLVWHCRVPDPAANRFG